jgi:hypothetical protein
MAEGGCEAKSTLSLTRVREQERVNYSTQIPKLPLFGYVCEFADGSQRVGGGGGVG